MTLYKLQKLFILDDIGSNDRILNSNATKGKLKEPLEEMCHLSNINTTGKDLQLQGDPFLDKTTV